ncbi:hypothetical protein N0M98_16445 [Paenibacillus doosanensis]|nr:hypothetical protein [Paenibacillus doosanensis]MCS7461745.1 hypothetical protein [Paenibacillus doosanensis]
MEGSRKVGEVEVIKVVGLFARKQTNCRRRNSSSWHRLGDILKDSNNGDEEFINQDNPPFIWCLVGNIIEERYVGEAKVIGKGTKKFSPNSKVYCFPALWGDGYEEIKVIGRTRRRRNYSIVITSSKYITNWRLQKVFAPYIVKTMLANRGWDGTEKSKDTIMSMLMWLPNVTMKIIETGENMKSQGEVGDLD